MAVALETFVKQLEDSGILSAGKLANFLPPKASPQDADQLARDLVRAGKLTAFQAQHVLAGRARSLILGNYTLLDRIGAGGMGQVFKAQHRRMERTVAIKMLPPATTKDPLALARFQREVKAASRLLHPNIVSAFDADESHGVHFLVMEYVEGMNLSALVKKNGPLPIAEAVAYVLQAATGLAYAHGEGVVHRDVKPGNLLLDNKGTVKILDMGLARIDQPDGSQAELTGSGVVMGTVDFMAPEQGISTKHVDARADIYSLGCTLYYLLSGQPTYAGETVGAKLLAHFTEPIPELTAARADIPPGLEIVFKRMLAKQVQDRYQSMPEVIADLQALAAGHGPASTCPPTSMISGTGNGARTAPRFVTEPPTAKVERALSAEVAVAAADAERRPEPPGRPGEGKAMRMAVAGLGCVAALLAGVAFFRSPMSETRTASSGGVTAVSALAGTQALPDSHGALPSGPCFLEFNGSASHIEVPHWKFSGNTSLTAEAWIHAPPYNKKAGEVLLGDPQNAGFYLTRGVNGWRFLVGDGKSYRAAAARTQAAADRPLQLAGVYDQKQGEIRFYLDGVLQSRVPFPEPYKPSPGTMFMIGCNPDGQRATKEFFTGRVREVRISQVARYEKNYAPQDRFEPDADTILLYHLDEGSGDVAHDASGHANDGKIVAGNWVRGGEPIRITPPPTAAGSE